MNILNDNVSTSTESTEPIRYCRCCGSLAATAWQHYRMNGATLLPSVLMITCVESSCELHLQTIGDDTDLRPYDVTAQYSAYTGALLPRYMRCSNVGPLTREDKQFRNLVRTGHYR